MASPNESVRYVGESHPDEDPSEPTLKKVGSQSTVLRVVGGGVYAGCGIFPSFDRRGRRGGWRERRGSLFSE
ncbi:UNVERIFIED_CONTAM: hypothetical protein Sradi_3873500 [Sesamum radiatum]|uniref:Uncharacterized protein n=1 Tax=Sesamum radiatum TaxID=300843 RepID=A0AAW2Q2T3_SESRA